MGHGYLGTVDHVGDDVAPIRRGQFVIGSFFACGNSCEICRAGWQSACVVPACTEEFVGADGTQAEYPAGPARRRHRLVATPDLPTDDLVPSLLTASDVLGTGWFDAVAAQAGPGKPVAAVGAGAVGLLAASSPLPRTPGDALGKRVGSSSTLLIGAGTPHPDTAGRSNAAEPR